MQSDDGHSKVGQRSRIREFTRSGVWKRNASAARAGVALPDIIQLEGRKYFSTEIFPNDVEALDGYDELHYLCTAAVGG
jgi:hypothetical protein